MSATASASIRNETVSMNADQCIAPDSRFFRFIARLVFETNIVKHDAPRPVGRPQLNGSSVARYTRSQRISSFNRRRSRSITMLDQLSALGNEND